MKTVFRQCLSWFTARCDTSYSTITFPRAKMGRITKNQQLRCGLVSPHRGKHLLVHGDSASLSFDRGFGLLLTSPPYYHPKRASDLHGDAYVGQLSTYVDAISQTLVRCADSVEGRRVCFVKTDVWFRGTLIPVGFELARACMKRGLRMQAHWVWRRSPEYSPYRPAFSNIFVFADHLVRPNYSCVLDSAQHRRAGVPSSFTPELFTELARRLCDKKAVILDPYAGVGASIHAALVTCNSSVGIESSIAQITRAKQLLKHHSRFSIRYAASVQRNSKDA